MPRFNYTLSLSSVVEEHPLFDLPPRPDPKEYRKQLEILDFEPRYSSFVSSPAFAEAVVRRLVRSKDPRMHNNSYFALGFSWAMSEPEVKIRLYAMTNGWVGNWNGRIGEVCATFNVRLEELLPDERTLLDDSIDMRKRKIVREYLDALDIYEQHLREHAAAHEVWPVEE